MYWKFTGWNPLISNGNGIFTQSKLYNSIFGLRKFGLIVFSSKTINRRSYKT